MKNLLPFFAILLLVTGCTVGKESYNPNKKFSPKELQEDYLLFRNILEESHPSLYWYSSKDSIDHYFETGKSKLNDSLTETKFRNVLSYVLSQIHCGHTTVRPSKAAIRYAERAKTRVFPLNIKTWADTVVVTSNLNPGDSNILRGVVLKSIDGRPVSTIIDSLFRHLSSDGYNLTHKYQSLSNAGVFRFMYSSVYGLKTKIPVAFIDTLGRLKEAELTLSVTGDTGRKKTSQRRPSPSKKEKRKQELQSMRSLRTDTALNTAFLEVNSFATGNKLRSFFKRSFRQIRKKNIHNLVVDMRGNGGGSVMLSNLLTKYIADAAFKIADSLYAIKNKSSYRQYQSNYFINRLFFIFLSRKKRDGYYHFSHFENRYFKPRKKNHFSGDTYILIGGNTFSAATLFTQPLRDQPNVTVVGEETGGGAYGNTAWLIPDVTLPHTKVRFRLPLFRLVIDKNAEKGRGVQPEVEVVPTVNAIRRNADFKMDKVIEMIKEKQHQ